MDFSDYYLLFFIFIIIIINIMDILNSYELVVTHGDEIVYRIKLIELIDNQINNI